MKTLPRSRRMQFFVTTATASAALVLGILTQGCAPANQGKASTDASALATAPISGQTGGSAGNVASGTGLLGNYVATFVTSAGGHGEVRTTPLLNIRAEGSNAILTVSGMNGVNFSSELALFQQPIGDKSNMTVRIYSRWMDINSISREPFSIDLILTLKNGSYDPANSRIRILDCGSYQAAPCALPNGDTLAPRDARFEGSLIRK